MTPPGRRRTDVQSPDSPLRALVVDDNESYLALVSALVRRHDFDVTRCGDGEQALAVLAERTFDLLVIDYEMPRMNGFELISRIRAMPAHAEVYAVMLTARDDLETKLAALRLGYDDFLVKSESELEIAAKLTVARRLVSRQRRLDASIRELYGLATRDELTGLFNRRFFFAEIERLLLDGETVNLVLFDLDEFKQVNDTFGHLAGDRILRDLGSLFLRRTRHEDLVARFGGDEFVMVVNGVSPEEVDVIARRIAVELAMAQWVFGGDMIGVGVTTGFSCSALMEAPTLQKLLAACDRDLYKNKWIRKHPELDPRLYQYDDEPEGRVVEWRKGAEMNAERRTQNEE